MKQMIIGSTALARYGKTRKPKDLDLFSPTPLEGADVFWHSSLGPYLSAIETGGDRGFASFNQLYTIKVSHSFWDLHGTWSKHMNDILSMQIHGVPTTSTQKPPVFHQDFYDILYPIWEEKHGKKKAKLIDDPAMFFNGNVTRIYVHDTIHESVAYGERPLFESILRDGSSVIVDRAKFDALPYETQLQLVREEVYATALERRLIPSDYKESPRGAYAWALKQTITSFWKGYFALWVVLHYKDLYKPDIDYRQVHLDNKHKLVRI